MSSYGHEMCSSVVFQRWVDKSDPCFQYVFDNLDISGMQNYLDQNWLDNGYVYEFNKLLEKTARKPYLTKSVIDFFCLEPIDFLSYKFKLTSKTKERLCNIYSYLETDIGKFIEYIELHGFSDELINNVESSTSFLTVIGKYKNFAQLLFAHSDPFLTQNYLFCVANNLFEFCFNPKTAQKFEKLLQYSKNYPIVRMIYSIMWNYLAGHGWKDWNRSTLAALQKLTKNNGTVVYIAGGTDIYQLLKYGIYNITVIDPMLPSQPDYYSNVWEWLVVVSKPDSRLFLESGASPKGDGSTSSPRARLLNGARPAVPGVATKGEVWEPVEGCECQKRFNNKNESNGIGDVVKYDFGNVKLVMKRTGFDKTGVFQAELSFGKVVDIVQSRTEWTVLDDMDNVLGKVVFERRFCNQEDFVEKDNQHLLISFNELYYIASNNLNDSWGIDISKIGDNFKMFVKQLRNPVDKNVLCNMQKADNSDFLFIKLGSNIN